MGSPSKHLTTTSSIEELSSQRASRQVKSTEHCVALSVGRSVFLISTLNATVLVGAMNTGMMTVALPRITEDLDISRSLQLWSVTPVSKDLISSESESND